MTKPPTRPPFAEFSSIAIGKMMEWLTEHDPWSERMPDVLFEHVEPVTELRYHVFARRTVTSSSKSCRIRWA